MSRHRSVRGLNYDEEYDDYYCDTYGHSVEENYCVSPGLQAEYTFDRSRQKAMGDYMVGVEENSEGESKEAEDDEESGDDSDRRRARLDSMHVEFPKNLSPDSETKLKECLETLRDVTGETIAEPLLLDAAIRASFEIEVALKILNEPNDKSGLHRVDSAASDTSMEDLKQKLETICREKENQGKAAAAVEKPPNYQLSTLGVLHAAGAAAPNHTPASSKSGSTCSTPRKMISPSPSLSKPKPKLDPLAEYAKERGSGDKQHLNMVVIGHVDAGKSTLMGHLLYKLGQVNQKTMHKYEQESKKAGKQSFAYAWVLDETGEERKRGITMDVGLSKFETSKKIVTLMDAPGHKDFIPNMITGASQADVALLVVDATRGEFETGFESGGQTREHALLARSLGVSQMAVVVNKLDNEKWSQTRFNEIAEKLSAFLVKHVGLRKGDVTYLPCSGLTGQNLISPPSEEGLKSWYTGPCLVDVIDCFKAPERPVAKPFRLSVTDVFKGISSAVSISGRVECGLVKAGDSVIIQPQGETCNIKQIAFEDTVSSGSTAFAGDQIIATLAGIDPQNVSVGSVLCDPSHPAPVTSKFVARIVVFNVEIPITRGFPVIFHQNSFSEQAAIKRLIAEIHRSTGEVVKSKPRCLVKNTSALVQLEISRPVCVELYKDVKELGRFMLRSGGSTIAAGMVTEIL